VYEAEKGPPCIVPGKRFYIDFGREGEKACEGEGMKSGPVQTLSILCEAFTKASTGLHKDDLGKKRGGRRREI